MRCLTEFQPKVPDLLASEIVSCCLVCSGLTTKYTKQHERRRFAPAQMRARRKGLGNYTQFLCFGYRFGAAARLEFCKDIRNVSFDRRRRDEEAVRDVLIG